MKKIKIFYRSVILKKQSFTILILIISFQVRIPFCYSNPTIINHTFINVKNSDSIFKKEMVYSQINLTATANLLFKNIKTKLTISEKIRICELLEISISKDKKHFIAKYDKTQEYPFDALVYITDLNKDENEEVFISYGNSFTSGIAGVEIALFIKDRLGFYQKNLGFPGLLPDALKSNYKGYPDLLIGGPGFQIPVWRWNGSKYIFLISIKGTKTPKGVNIENISKKYFSKI